ncbi:hypothetical protein LCU68_003984 [Salmonella enterica]|nr:hypothetical protein [Salmonella enterica]
MLLIHLYSNLIGACEERNGKPRSLSDRKAGYEIHHITAKSQGGTNHAYNLVYLTPREHYTAHHILARIYGGSMSSAFWLMSHSKQGTNNRSYPITSRQFATAKSLALPLQRLVSRGNKGRSGQPLSDELKAKISAALKGRVSGMAGKSHSTETKSRIAQASKGKRHTQEARERMSKAVKAAYADRVMGDAERNRRSEAQQGKKQIRATCPHCLKNIAVNVYARCHGDKCKQRLIDICTTDQE